MCELGPIGFPEPVVSVPHRGHRWALVSGLGWTEEASMVSYVAEQFAG